MFSNVKSRTIRTLILALGAASLSLCVVSPSFAHRGTTLQNPAAHHNAAAPTPAQTSVCDDDGPGLGGGYGPVSDGPGLGGGYLILDDDGPGLGGGYGPVSDGLRLGGGFMAVPAPTQLADDDGPGLGGGYGNGPSSQLATSDGPGGSTPYIVAQKITQAE